MISPLSVYNFSNNEHKNMYSRPYIDLYGSKCEIGLKSSLKYCVVINPANTQHLQSVCTASAQRIKRWSNIVQMVYRCFVYTGNII